MGRDALACIRPAEAVELVRQRGVEGRRLGPVPVVERVLGPADGRLGTAAQRLGHLQGPIVHGVVVDAQRHEADALRLLAREGVAGQQVVLGLGHAAQQRPADGGVVAGGDAEPRVAIDDARRLRGDRDVGEQPGDESGAHGGPVHRRDDRLAAVDDPVGAVNSSGAPVTSGNLQVVLC